MDSASSSAYRSSHRGRRHGQHRDDSFRLQRIALAFIPIALAGVILLQGGQLVGVKGFVLFTIGFFLLCQPPQVGMGKVGDQALMALAILPLLAFLPALVVPHGPWRDLALNHFEITLPYTVAPDLHALLEWLCWTWASWGAFYLFININPTHGERRFLLAEWVLITFLLALGVLIGNAKGLKYALVPDARVFTYFPSRNQTGTILFLGGIIGFGFLVESVLRRRILRAFVFGGLVLVLFTATVGTNSRAAAVIFCAGCMLVLFLKIRDWKRQLVLKLGVPFLIGMGSLFVLTGGDVSRLLNVFQSGDFRFMLYWDTLHLVGAHPLTGVGLGNFANVIPFYREASAISQRPLHPESDLLWWVSEVGLFGLIAGGVLIWQMVKAVRPIRYDGQVSTRAIPAAALIAYGVHAVVDVPMHFFGSLLPAFFIYSMANRYFEEKVLFPCWVFRVMGFILIGCGGFWMTAALIDKPWHTSIAIAQENEAITQGMQKSDKELLEKTFQTAFAHRKFDWWLYYERGDFILHFFKEPEIAKKDFSRALFLEPISSIVPFWIGVSWLPYSAEATYEAWRIALNRQSADMQWVYEDMMRRSSGYPNFAPYLAKLSKEDAFFRARYLECVYPEIFKEEFASELVDNEGLKKFSLEVRRRLFIRWARVAPEAFFDYSRDNATSVPDLWYVSSQAYIAKKQWQEAATLLHANTPIPRALSVPEGETLQKAAHRFRLNPHDIWLGGNLLSLQIQAEDWHGASGTLNILAADSPVPAFVYYWKAAIAFNNGLYQESCGDWDRYFEAVKKAIESDTHALARSQNVVEANSKIESQYSIGKKKNGGLNF